MLFCLFYISEIKNLGYAVPLNSGRIKLEMCATCSVMHMKEHGMIETAKIVF